MKNIASLTAEYTAAFNAYAADKRSSWETGNTPSERLMLVMLIAKKTLDLATGNLDCPRSQVKAQLADCRRALAKLDGTPGLVSRAFEFAVDGIFRLLFIALCGLILFAAGAGLTMLAVGGSVMGGVFLAAPAAVCGTMVMATRGEASRPNLSI